MDREIKTYLDDKFKAVDGEFKNVGKRFDAVDERLLIKFSYAELDHRIRTLEEDLSLLKARVEELERRSQ